MTKKPKYSKSAALPKKVAKKAVAKASDVKARKAVSAKLVKKTAAKATARGSGVDVPAKTKETRVITGISLPSPGVIAGIGVALQDAMFIDYIAKNVGSQANDVLRELTKGPRKDEALAEKVSIKLNEVRRVLNLLNKHGIVRYDVKRDSSGWLTFEWHVDYSSFTDFYKTLNQKAEVSVSALPEGCNDFFVCSGCSKVQGLIYPFDVAYEKSFKCGCGKSLDAITRTEAENFMRN